MTLPATRHHMLSHTHAAQLENVQFMLDNGETLERACARAGVDPEAMDQRIRRTRLQEIASDHE